MKIVKDILLRIYILKLSQLSHCGSADSVTAKIMCTNNCTFDPDIRWMCKVAFLKFANW